MMRNFESLVQECENDVRQGAAQDAFRRLSSLNFYRIPRRWRLPLANLCRRTGHIVLGLKILSPVINSRFNRRGASPSSGELAEHAVLLLNSGAVVEALQTLEKVSVERSPEALLYQAFCHFAEWNYPAAIGPLEKFLRGDITSYSRLVGQVNLSAALVATTQYGQAFDWLKQSLDEARANTARRLEGNCHELLAQIHIDSGRYDLAREELNRAADMLADDPIRCEVFVKKWLAVVESVEEGKTDRLHRFRSESVARGNWENVRESDLFLSKVEFDQERFDHLYFGSPFQYYRSMIERYVGKTPSTETYLFGEAHTPCMNVSTGEVSGVVIKGPGKNTRALLASLLKDFYRPRSLGGLFSDLCPGEHFDVFSSPGRVHQQLRRTRQWLGENRFPVEILESQGTYKLNLSGSFSFSIPRVASLKQNQELHFDRLVHQFEDQDFFTAREVCEKLSLPKTTTNRLLNWAKEKSLLKTTGSKSNTRYEFIRKAGSF